jgi:hypothetical protein
MAWWIAEKGTPLEEEGKLEVSETAAKNRAVAQSQSHPGQAYEVRYHANANAPTEVKWEAVDGAIYVATGPRTPSERRIGVRHFACFPASVDRPKGDGVLAMMHDLSVSGAQLVVRADLKVGDALSLQLFVTGDPSDPRTRKTSGRVVRVEELDAASRGAWTHRVAVQFDEALKDFEDEIAALEKRQRELGLRP